MGHCRRPSRSLTFKNPRKCFSDHDVSNSRNEMGFQSKVTKGVWLLDGTVCLSRPRPVSGVNHVAPTLLADGWFPGGS